MTIADELPLGHVPDIPHWSENYCLTGYDYRTGIGYWMHIGTWMHDMSLWREIVFFMLPDGTVLMNRSFGCGDDSRGPAGPGLKLTLEEDGERWRFNYDGPVTAIPAADVNGEPPLKDPRTIERFRADMNFAGSAPVWKFDTVDNDTWGKFHIEQSGDVKGTFERGADVWQFDGHGYRDHSRGPRQLGDVRGECWLQIRFPEGDSVCVFQMWHGGEDTPGLNVTRVIDRDGHIADGTVQESPRIRGFEDTQRTRAAGRHLRRRGVRAHVHAAARDLILAGRRLLPPDARHPRTRTGLAGFRGQSAHALRDRRRPARRRLDGALFLPARRRRELGKLCCPRTRKGAAWAAPFTCIGRALRGSTSSSFSSSAPRTCRPSSSGSSNPRCRRP